MKWEKILVSGQKVHYDLLFCQGSDQKVTNVYANGAQEPSKRHVPRDVTCSGRNKTKHRNRTCRHSISFLHTRGRKGESGKIRDIKATTGYARAPLP